VPGAGRRQNERVILILGETPEAGELADALRAGGVPVRPAPASSAAELAAALAEHEAPALVDAGGPFDEAAAAAAVAASERGGVPLLRLELPGWRPRAGDRLRWVADLDEASRTFEHERRVLLVAGNRGLDAFAHRDDSWFLVRCDAEPQSPLPARHALLRHRGPHTPDAMLALVDEHRLDVVVTRDSGGADAQAALDAARERALPAVIVRRPPRPEATTLTSVDGALRWARRHAGVARRAGGSP
jgi:precorrin-6A/cobalt-precorrin-6A reductase